MSKKFEIRNSTAEFLVFQIEGKEDSVQVVYREKQSGALNRTQCYVTTSPTSTAEFQSIREVL